MPNREINESPERSTSGLGSVTQVLDTTGAQTFAIGNTSSLYPVVGALMRRVESSAHESERSDRNVDVRTALRESLRENKSIILELAKY